MEELNIEGLKPITIDEAYAVFDEKPTDGDIKANEISYEEALKVLKDIEKTR